MSFEPSYPWVRGRSGGSRDRALIKWLSEDQSWLRNEAEKRLERNFF